MPKKTLHKLLITGAVALLGVGFLVYSSLANSGRYRMVDKLMAAPSDFVGKKLQVHGWVEPGSIKEWIDHQETVRTFVLEKNGKRIKVENRGPAPDTFKDQSEVVATGRLEERDGQYVLVAKELSAKCPSKYEGAQSNKALAIQPVYH
jgi:cytochrome c-type biogenesis protein CcmE